MSLVPRGGTCKVCGNYTLWGDVIRGSYRRRAGAVAEEEEEDADVEVEVDDGDIFLSDLSDREDEVKPGFGEWGSRFICQGPLSMKHPIYITSGLKKKTRASSKSRGKTQTKEKSRKKKEIPLALRGRSGSSDGESFDFDIGSSAESSDGELPTVRRKISKSKATKSTGHDQSSRSQVGAIVTPTKSSKQKEKGKSRSKSKPESNPARIVPEGTSTNVNVAKACVVVKVKKVKSSTDKAASTPRQLLDPISPLPSTNSKRRRAKKVPDDSGDDGEQLPVTTGRPKTMTPSDAKAATTAIPSNKKGKRKLSMKDVAAGAPRLIDLLDMATVAPFVPMGMQQATPRSGQKKKKSEVKNSGLEREKQSPSLRHRVPATPTPFPMGLKMQGGRSVSGDDDGEIGD